MAGPAPLLQKTLKFWILGGKGLHLRGKNDKIPNIYVK